MPLNTSKKELLDLMQRAYPIVPLKSTLQVLSNFRASFANGNLEIAATDLDHYISARLAVAGKGNFDVTVNARKIFEVVRELPDGNVSIDVDQNIFVIQSEKGFSCRLAGADSHDFPAFPQRDVKSEFDVEIPVLSEMIAKSGFAVSKDESRACLCGILWEIEPEGMSMVATDGHRLGWTTVKGTFAVQEKVSAIVSPKSMLHTVRIGGGEGKQSSVHVSIGDKYVVFSTDSAELCTKLIEGPYPDYRKVIPQGNPRSATLGRGMLQEAVRRVSVLSNQKTNLVKFAFRKNELEMVVLNRDIGGEAREVLPIEYDQSEHTIGFNGHYLGEIVGIINADKIRMEMNTQISACLLFPEGQDPAKKVSEDLFLIMPLKIIDEN